MDFLTQPWPWYIGGPLIGLTVPLLLFFGGKQFGISTVFRDFCGATLPDDVKPEFCRFDWKQDMWNIVFVLGIVIGGFLAGQVFPHPLPIHLSPATIQDLTALGLPEYDLQQFLPVSIFSWSGLFTPSGFILMVIGGFLVGFGARWAGGCTSGHAIMGLSALEPASLVAVIGFFIGGLITTHFLLPLIL